MNWENIKKNLNRAGTSILQKTGIVDKTVDSEFDAAHDRMRHLKAQVDTLYKESRASLDAARAIFLGQDRTAAGIATILADSSGDVARQARSLRDNMEHGNERTRNEYDEAYRATVMEPVTRFATLFPDAEELIKKRDKKLLDYDAARAKVRRSTDRPSSDHDKLPKLGTEEEIARKAYSDLNHNLVVGLNSLDDLKVDYLGPSLDAFLQIQAMVARDNEMMMRRVGPVPSKEYETSNLLGQLSNLPILSI